MPEKTKTEKDKMLIKKVLGYVPSDWARYPNGEIAVISPSGQKFVLTPEHIAELVKIQTPAPKPKKSPSKKNSSAPAKKSSAAEKNSPPAKPEDEKK